MLVGAWSLPLLLPTLVTGQDCFALQACCFDLVVLQSSENVGNTIVVMKQSNRKMLTRYFK